MHRIALLFCLFIGIAPLTISQGVIGGQDNLDNTWFYAWNMVDLDEVVAFNLDGETRTLLNGVGRSGPAYRIDDQTMLAQFEDDTEQVQLFLLTPDEAILIGSPADDTYIMEHYSAPWAVFYPQETSRRADVDVLLVNTGTGDWDVLTVPERWIAVPCCAFSDDGTMMRWFQPLNLGEGGGTIYNLLERNLATGADNLIYTAVSDENPYRYMSFIANNDGTQWIERRMDTTAEDSRIPQYNLIGMDAEIQPLTYLQPGRGINYRFFEDMIIATDFACDDDCEIALLSTPDASPVRYRLPNMQTFDVLARTATDDLLVQQYGSLLHLRPDAAPLTLIPPDLFQNVNTISYASPDGAYAFTVQLDADEEAITLLGVYDVAADDVVFSLPLPESDTRLFAMTNINGPWMFISRLDSIGGTGLFNWQTQESYTLSEQSTRFVESVDDSRVLVFSLDRQDNASSGIFLLDLGTSEESRLLSDAYQVINGVDLRLMAGGFN